MPSPDDADSIDGGTINSDLAQLVAAAADLCRKPLRHGVVCDGPDADGLLRLEARNERGERQPDADLELEIYRSGRELNMTLSWRERPELPILWHGHHPVWMDGDSGERRERPPEGAALEALARRLRALLGVAPQP